MTVSYLKHSGTFASIRLSTSVDSSVQEFHAFVLAAIGEQQAGLSQIDKSRMMVDKGKSSPVHFNILLPNNGILIGLKGVLSTI